LTAAGREFERFAQSFVRLWERARQQLTIPPGRTSVVALGGELSLWNPLLLDWLVWMKKSKPEIAIHAHVGVPDQLLDQLRTGVLDIAVLYAPKLLPGFKVELLVEEQLVLVKTRSKDGEPEGDYVYVDWGPLFAAQHDASSTAFGEPGLLVGLGPLGLSYILRAGGMGYFRKGVVAPHIEAGELEIVAGAPEFTYPAYAVYPDASEARADVQEALRGLKQVVG
jgi:DNA-binding transcriptional LysR family regulator